MVTPSPISQNIEKLISSAHDMQTFLASIPYGVRELQQRASRLIDEMNRCINQKNEWLVLQLFEASIIPQLIDLAKSIKLVRAQLSSRKHQPVPQQAVGLTRVTPRPAHHTQIDIDNILIALHRKLEA